MDKLIRSKLVLGVCIICFTLTSLGCEPLRKKFTRKKKQEKNAPSEFIPILEPIDYPEPMVSASEQYGHFYSLWKVWYKDMMESFYEKGNEKRAKFLLDQVIVQMQEMEKLIIESRKKEFDVYLFKFIDIRKEFDKPEGMINRVSLSNRLIREEKAFRNIFTPAKMKDSFIQ